MMASFPLRKKLLLVEVDRTANRNLLLHARTQLKDSALGSCDSFAGLPLHEYEALLQEDKKVIRHLSINRAKRFNALGVILIGVQPFQEITGEDNQYTYFMCASRAKQLLAIVYG